MTKENSLSLCMFDFRIYYGLISFLYKKFTAMPIQTPDLVILAPHGLIFNYNL